MTKRMGSAAPCAMSTSARIGAQRSPTFPLSATWRPGGWRSSSIRPTLRPIGLQPKREKSGEVGRERETGTLASVGLKWTRRVSERSSLIAGDVVYVEPIDGQNNPISLASNSRSQRRHRRDGPLYGSRLCDDRRLFLRSVGIQPRDPGPPAAGFLIQADRLRDRARQWLYALLDHSRRADLDRSRPWPWRLVAAEFRRQIRRPAYAALWCRAFDQPDDRASGARRRHAAYRRICQTLRHLRRPAAVLVDVAWLWRNDFDAHDHGLFHARQWRQARSSRR